MELKRIIARDSRSANEKAIQLYGNDVLIISSQRVDQQTELIVAVDVCVPPVNEAADGASLTQSAFATGGPSKSVEFTPFSQVFQQANSGQLMSASPENEEASPVVDVARVDSTLPPLTPSVAMAEPVPPVAEAAVVAYEQQRNHEIVDLLRQEMAALRKDPQFVQLLAGNVLFAGHHAVEFLEQRFGLVHRLALQHLGHDRGGRHGDGAARLQPVRAG